MALCTTTYAKQSADLARVDTTWLSNIIDAASSMIEGYCDRTFSAADYEETVDGTGLDWIYVKNAPINSFTSIVITDSSNNEETILASQFRYDSTAGKITFKYNNTSSYLAFPEDFQNVKVTYNGGYTTIPAAVQQACALVTRNIYSRTSGGTNPAYKTEKMGEHSFTRESMNNQVMTPDVMALLDRYVRCNIV